MTTRPLTAEERAMQYRERNGPLYNEVVDPYMVRTLTKMLESYAADETAALRAERDEFKAVVDKLPKTADGVIRIARTDKHYPMDMVWGLPVSIKTGKKSERVREGRIICNDNEDAEEVEFDLTGAGDWCYLRVSDCYSTREAAEVSKTP